MQHRLRSQLRSWRRLFTRGGIVVASHLGPNRPGHHAPHEGSAAMSASPTIATGKRPAFDTHRNAPDHDGYAFWTATASSSSTADFDAPAIPLAEPKLLGDPSIIAPAGNLSLGYQAVKRLLDIVG